VSSPMKLSETPVQHKCPPPLLGQHTDEILRDVLGWQDPAIAALRDRKVI
jgi:crotonobetainyl-CoA:carnitine CoA-transferase CaiB-like acyl-CoA transferase